MTQDKPGVKEGGNGSFYSYLSASTGSSLDALLAG
jgi:hypothetical protein